MAICVLPILLNLVGVDFGSSFVPFEVEGVGDLTTPQLLDNMFYRLTGAFTHTILEWSAFSTALFTVLLAFVHFSITKDATTPIIGVALFTAGCMDAFHTLAAARLIDASAPNKDLIPFTWAICRIFNALIMMLGLGIILIKKDVKEVRANVNFIVGMSVVFGIIAYGIIAVCANSETLPQTQYPDALITRPYDAIPLVLFIIAGVWLYPLFYRRHPSLFSYALIVSAVPEVITEIHMAFGSTSLFDNHFNIAHFLKIVAYVVPFSGLAMDYIQTYKKEQMITKNLKEEQEKLKKINANLDSFVYVASHDMKTPLNNMQGLVDILGEEDLEDDERRNLQTRLKTNLKQSIQTINDLVGITKIQKIKDQEFITVKFSLVIGEVLEVLEETIESTKAKFEFDFKESESVVFSKVSLKSIVQNLIDNSLKYGHEDRPPLIKISSRLEENHVVFVISDNGLGIDLDRHKEKLFTMFSRFHDHTEGSGIGLAIVKNTLENNDGKIEVESKVGEGTTFKLYFKNTVS
ncbi:MAG: GHKL domain-containing protein [Flavobacteriales bacterium]|nr:GHKL domain-containing protein [Flavobacteriales bacterium]